MHKVLQLGCYEDFFDRRKNQNHLCTVCLKSALSGNISIYIGSSAKKSWEVSGSGRLKIL